MKIAVVFDGIGFGGIERVGIDYIKIMSNLGYEVDAYNLNPTSNEMEIELKEYCKVINHSFPHKLCPELYSYGVKKWWWGMYAYPIVNIGLTILLTIRRIFKKHRSKNYDVAIAFSGHFNDLTFVVGEFVKAEKKLCWLHGSLAEYLLIAHGFGNLYKKIKNLNSLSDYMQDSALIGNKYLMQLNINKIYNPVAILEKKVDKKVTDELKSKYGEFFLMVGRFTKQKDQLTVIKSMKIIKEKYGLNNKMLFVGDGDERVNAEILVVELGLEESVIFIGSRMDVQNFYSAAKLFIHSSPAEGLPTVLLEAMSFGLPIVATNSLPGVEEILQQNKYGLICPVGKEENMAESIYKLSTDEKLYDHYVKQGYVRIKDFQPDIIGKQLQKILDTLI